MTLRKMNKWQKKSCLKDRLKNIFIRWVYIRLAIQQTKIWGGGFQKSGIPDILACVNGVMVAVEVKASNGRPSELQKLNISRINKSGGIGVFLYPEGFEQFKELLKGVINCGIHTAALTALKDASEGSKCVILKE